MPFTDINKIVEAQFAGRTFPEDGSGSVDVTVKHATVAASGDRLLISLLVNAKEKKSFFGFGGEATVYIWGTAGARSGAADPAADQHPTRRRIRSRVRTARARRRARRCRICKRHWRKRRPSISSRSSANAQKEIAAAIADFQKNEDGVRVAAEITSLQLADIAFDSKTLRVIAEADGAINVYVTALGGL